MTAHYEEAAAFRARLAELEATEGVDPDEVLELRHAFFAALEQHARDQRRTLEAAAGVTGHEIQLRRQDREVKQAEMDRLGVDAWPKALAVIVREQNRADEEIEAALGRGSG